MTSTLKDKIVESLTSILPIALIVVVLSIFLTPLDAGTFVLFLIGVVLLIVGMGFFTLGADLSMLVIGEKIGSAITHSGKIWLIALISLVIGIIITIAEPDLQILAEQVQSVAEKTPLGNYLLILTVAVGVGIFLTIAMLRIVFKIRLSIILIAFYIIAFVLSIFVSPSFWAVSFDSGGVTTGPMTVPFIMSMGVGVASLRTDKNAQGDSFGLVALSSIGPIIAVLVLGIVFKIADVTYTLEPLTEVTDTQNVALTYLSGFGSYAKEVIIALSHNGFLLYIPINFPLLPQKADIPYFGRLRVDVRRPRNVFNGRKRRLHARRPHDRQLPREHRGRVASRPRGYGNRIFRSSGRACGARIK